MVASYMVKGTIGTHIPHSVGHNIEIGKNTQTGGYGITAGSDGSNTSFGAKCLGSSRCSSKWWERRWSFNARRARRAQW